LPLDSPLYVVNRKTYEEVNFFTESIADAFDMYILLISLADKLSKLEDNNLAKTILTEEGE